MLTVKSAVRDTVVGWSCHAVVSSAGRLIWLPFWDLAWTSARLFNYLKIKKLKIKNK